jgi:hypothetical protein
MTRIIRNLSNLLLIAATVCSVSTVMAEQKRMSPHETIPADIDGAKVTIVYGRPYTVKPNTTEVRKIWGGLVSFGNVWRTGADEATILTTDKALVMGDTTLPAGKYSLYTLPAADGTAKLVVNKQTGQWGTVYDEKQDFARIAMKGEKLDKSVDQFTMAIDKGASGGGVLKMSWEKMQYSLPFTVKK